MFCFNNLKIRTKKGSYYIPDSDSVQPGSHQMAPKSFHITFFAFFHVIWRLHIKHFMYRFRYECYWEKNLAFTRETGVRVSCETKRQRSLILTSIRLYVFIGHAIPWGHAMRKNAHIHTQSLTIFLLSLNLNFNHSVHFSICESCAVLKPCQSHQHRVF